MRTASLAGFLRPRYLLLVAAAGAIGALVTVDGEAGIQGSGRRAVIVIGTVGAASTGVTIQAGEDQYWVAGAQIHLDGKPGLATQLQEGDVVTLQGSTSNDNHTIDVASDVTFEGAVQGAVDAVDAANGAFVVLSQRVLVSSSTVFDPLLGPNGLPGLAVGTLVEVSGVRDSRGDLIAARVDSRGSAAGSRVVGSVTNIDTTQGRLNIGPLLVDYRAASIEGTLADGEIVSVQSTGFETNGTLVASRVAIESPVRGLEGETGRFQGVITSLAAPNYFEVNGLPVVVDASTHLSLKVPVSLDVAVSVSGTFDGNGVLIADKVQTKAPHSEQSAAKKN